MGVIIHLDREGTGSGGGGFNFAFTATDFNNLNSIAPQPVASGTLAYVFSSQGTAWLPGTIGGSYYPKGIYISDGASWVSDRNAIAEQLQINIDDIDQLEIDLAQEIVNRTNADTALDQISLNPTGGVVQPYDWNTVLTAGVYRGNGMTMNRPTGFNAFETVLVYTPIGTTYIVQQAVDGSGAAFAFRRSNNSGASWSNWEIIDRMEFLDQLPESIELSGNYTLPDASTYTSTRLRITNRTGQTQTVSALGLDTIEGDSSLQIFDGETFDLIVTGTNWTL